MPSCPQLLVIADDLTGSNDAGAQFAVAGIRSIVFADWKIKSLPTEYPVAVVNTESRHILPREAAERVRRVTNAGLAAGVQFFYKKTDSTLRGNIGAELEALLTSTGARFIPFIPALPDLGRTTRDGIHYVYDSPIAETAFSQDPLNPICDSRIAEVLGSQAIVSIENARVEGCTPEVFKGITVFDCESNDDLRRIARTLTTERQTKVFAGSVALMRHLVPYLDIESAPPATAEPRLPILFVNGSVNERALEQVANGAGRFSRLQLTPGQLIGSHADLRLPPGNVLLCSISQRGELERFRDFGRAQGLSEKELHLRVADRTGHIVREILAAGVFQTIVVFGGDTLAGIAHANHWRSLVPLAELEPGVSVSRPSETDLTLISKAGAFGDPEVVGRIVRFVEREARIGAI